MKNFLYISIAAAVVIGGVAFYMLFNTQTEEVKYPVADEVTAEEVIDEGISMIDGVGSIRSILDMGSNLECTVSYKSDEYDSVETETVIFVSNNRMRGDSVSIIDGQEILSSTIIKDTNMYSWSVIEGEKYGVTISLAALMEMQESNNTPEFREPVPIDSEVDYSCKQWRNVDNSIFETPTDIIFKDFSSLINVGMEYGTSYSETGATNGCEVCDMLSGSDKEQCRAALSCQ